MLDKFWSKLKSQFALNWDMAGYDDIRLSMEAGIKIKGTNMSVLFLAIIIASIGLNMNSIPVIIGAMLISPLMGGIQGIGYGLSTFDTGFMRRAALGLAAQVLISLAASTIYFAITPISSASSEILARTSPTIWDVLIAVAGGLAGIIGLTRKEKSNVIPGVAIATALMPPLCTAGYGLATGQLQYFAGAFYLFFINGFFICLTAVVVLTILKVPRKAFPDKREKMKITRTIVILSIVVLIPSVVLTANTVNGFVKQKNVETFVTEQYETPQTLVLHSSFDATSSALDVALMGKTLSASQLDAINQKRADYGIADVQIFVTQLEVPQNQLTPQMEAYARGYLSDSIFSFIQQHNDLAQTNTKISELEARIAKLEQGSAG